MKFLAAFMARRSAPLALLLGRLFARKIVLAAALVLASVVCVAKY